MDRGDGHTTLSKYLVPLSDILEMVKMVDFMICIFYHTKKRDDQIFLLVLTNLPRINISHVT